MQSPRLHRRGCVRQPEPSWHKALFRAHGDVQTASRSSCRSLHQCIEVASQHSAYLLLYVSGICLHSLRRHRANGSMAFPDFHSLTVYFRMTCGSMFPLLICEWQILCIVRLQYCFEDSIDHPPLYLWQIPCAHVFQRHNNTHLGSPFQPFRFSLLIFACVNSALACPIVQS